MREVLVLYDLCTRFYMPMLRHFYAHTHTHANHIALFIFIFCCHTNRAKPKWTEPVKAFASWKQMQCPSRCFSFSVSSGQANP